MTFWVHSFKARRERDYAVIEAPQREYAMVALAGWKVVGSLMLDVHDEVLHGHIWHVYDNEGAYHGHNTSERMAVRYALQEITATWGGDETTPQLKRSLMRKSYGAQQHGTRRLEPDAQGPLYNVRYNGRPVT